MGLASAAHRVRRWLRPLFPAVFPHHRKLKIENYPELYENELSIAAMMLRAFLEPEEIKEMETKLISLSLEERSKFVAEKIAELNDLGDAIEIPKTPGEQKRAEAVFKALSWSPVGAVTFNPERDSVIAEHVSEKLIQPLAA